MKHQWVKTGNDKAPLSYNRLLGQYTVMVVEKFQGNDLWYWRLVFKGRYVSSSGYCHFYSPEAAQEAADEFIALLYRVIPDIQQKSESERIQEVIQPPIR